MTEETDGMRWKKLREKITCFCFGVWQSNVFV